MTLLAEVLLNLQKTAGPDGNGWYTALCPFHQDHRKPNLRFRETGFKCMACGQKGSLRVLAEKLGLKSESSSSGLTLVELAAVKRLPETFLRSIGLTDGFAGSWSQRCPCVDIPYMDEVGQVVAVQKRLSISQPPRFIWRRGARLIPYGLWRLREASNQNWIVIVEGASDCWTLWYHGIASIGLPGASTWKPEYSYYLNGFQTYLWVEPDTGGGTLLKDISLTLPDVRVIRAPEGMKDPSELYLSNKKGFVEAFNRLLSEAKPASVLFSEAVSEETSQLWTQIRTLAKDPRIVDRLKEIISVSGYAGDPRPALCTFIAITSRLLDRPLNIIFVAQSGSGKNASIEYVLPLFPDHAYHIVRASSPLALVYSSQSFSHKTVILWEADSLPEDGPAASAVRSLMSDQRLEYQVVEKDESGRQQVRVIKKEGPTGLVTTSIKPLREQASTRMLMVSIPDTVEQTKAVLQAIARQESSSSELESSQLWVAFQRWLEIAGYKQVSIPFADVLADKISSKSVRMRRDFSQVLTVIKVFAFLHQSQRMIDEHGRVVATLEDYRLTRWLLEEVFSTSTSGGLTVAIRDTVEAVVALYRPDSPVIQQQLAKHLGLAASTISYRVGRAISGGWLVNRSNRRGISAQLEPGAPIPDKTLLPDPDSLMLCVNPPENHSNTRILPGKQSVLTTKQVLEGFEGRFEQSFELPPKASFVPENMAVEGTVRVFESKSEEFTHTRHYSGGIDETGRRHWESEDRLLEIWRDLSIPDWRRVLQESIETGDSKREEYARQMLEDILEDSEYWG